MASTFRPPSELLQCAEDYSALQEAYNTGCGSHLQSQVFDYYREVFKKGQNKDWWESDRDAAAQWGISRQMMQRINSPSSPPGLSTLLSLGPRVNGFARLLGMEQAAPPCNGAAKRQAAIVAVLGWSLPRRRSLQEAIPESEMDEEWRRHFDTHACRTDSGALDELSANGGFATWLDERSNGGSMPASFWVGQADWFFCRTYLPGWEDALVTLERAASPRREVPDKESLEMSLYELRALRGALVDADASLQKSRGQEFDRSKHTRDLLTFAEKRLPFQISNKRRAHDGTIVLARLRFYGLEAGDFLEPQLTHNAVGYLALKSKVTRRQVTELLTDRATSGEFPE